MIEKSMDEILEKLAWIGFNKELLPWGLRGWVAELGLHVQSFEGGNRIQAGGRLRSYCEARSLAGKPLAGFCATRSRRIQDLYGMVVHVIRCNTHYAIDNRR